MNALLAGVPWTVERAAEAGFENLRGARTRYLGFASLAEAMDEDEDCFKKLDQQFDAALVELSTQFGEPEFLGRGWDCPIPGFRPEPHDADGPHRLAYWRTHDTIAFVAVWYGDNTRLASLEIGERTPEELEQPYPKAI